MISFPNAKINIGLNILRKRPDGYHDISSCFYPVALSDALEITPSLTHSLIVSGQGMNSVDQQADNLVTRAYDLLAGDFDLPPLTVYLLKGIPVGAGLGGGSSDAAFMIRMINEISGLGLSDDRKEEYARQLGSDCAFFVRNTPMYCYGRGDQFEEIRLSLKGLFVCLINPRIHISTAEAYAGVVPEPLSPDLKRILEQPVSEWKGSVTNDFEMSAFKKYPLLAQIKTDLYDAGALYASMSGSGSTVYGIFKNLVEIDNKFPDCFVWQGELH